MSRELGNLVHIPATKDEAECFRGKLRLSPVVDGLLFLEPAKKRAEGSPDYRVKLQYQGGWDNFGAGWWKKDRLGKPFLSMNIDHPEMSSDVNVSAFYVDEQPDPKNPDHMRIVWQRYNPNKRRAAAPVASGDNPYPR